MSSVNSYSESTWSGDYDLSPYAGSYQMIIGNSIWENHKLSNLRKLLIFSGTAIHSSSLHTIVELL